jgi:hypothetical protein
MGCSEDVADVVSPFYDESSSQIMAIRDIVLLSGQMALILIITDFKDK